MAPLIGILAKVLFPVVISEVQKKISEKKDTLYKQPTDVPLEVAGPEAIKYVAAGSIASKTAWFSLALLIIGFLEQNQQLLTSLISPDKIGYVIAGIGAISFFLRGLTTKSLVEKGE